MPPHDLPDDWPGRAHSHWCPVAEWTWHLQRMGPAPADAPTILLLHGTAGSTHGWHEVARQLAATHHVIAIDLPGQGFTHRTDAASLRASTFGTLTDVADAVGQLVDALALTPAIVAGHSAGAAIALRLALDQRITPSHIVGVCPALIPLPGWFHELVAPLVAPIATHPWVAAAAARLAAGTPIVPLLLASTGSNLSAAQLARYRTLLADAGRVRAALAMMARWDVSGVVRDLARAPQPLTIVAGRQDHWVPRDALAAAVQGLPGVQWRDVDGGHLLPEEHPATVAALLRGH